jgi:hypothetical protein
MASRTARQRVLAPAEGLSPARSKRGDEGPDLLDAYDQMPPEQRKRFLRSCFQNIERFRGHFVPMQTLSPATLALDTSAISISVFVGAPYEPLPTSGSSILGSDLRLGRGLFYLVANRKTEPPRWTRLLRTGTLVWM